MNKAKKETIVYGGAFNPPTVAHVAIIHAAAVYAAQNNADLWILPSGDRPDKTIPVPKGLRLAYIDAMLADADIPEGVSVRVLEDELERNILVETCDTVRELNVAYPDREFRFLFGADSTETMAMWRDGDWLLETLPMLVVGRAGSTLNPLARRVEHLNVATVTVSSTEVRARIEAGESVHGLVPPSVEKMLTLKL